MNKYKKTKFFYNTILYALLGVFAFLIPAQASDFEYESATIRRLTDHLFQEKMIDFDDPKQFKEYSMIEDCDIFRKYFSNDFEWNKIRLAIKKEMQDQKPSLLKTRIRVPGVLNLTRYNFTTQAFDIHEDYVFKDVGFLQLSSNNYKLCGGDYNKGDMGLALPNQYFLKPEIPFNLYRIPVSKLVAKKVLDKTVPNKDKEATRPAYFYMNVTLDAFFDIDKKAKGGVTAYVLGTVDSIDFYTDEYRQNKFKTLYYDVY